MIGGWVLMVRCCVGFSFNTDKGTGRDPPPNGNKIQSTIHDSTPPPAFPKRVVSKVQPHSRHGKPARIPGEPVGSGVALQEAAAAVPCGSLQQAHAPNPCTWLPRPCSPSHAETPACVWKPCLCLCFFTDLLGCIRGGVWVHGKEETSAFGGRGSAERSRRTGCGWPLLLCSSVGSSAVDGDSRQQVRTIRRVLRTKTQYL